MNRQNYTFTSESVSEGHPDKVCDRISDAVLDAFLAEDTEARVACETFATTDRVVIGGEVRGPAEVVRNVEEIARECVRDIGYEQEGFHWANMKVDSYLHAQSADIAQGVDASGNKDEGAGDQGIMFGFATTETSELMPAPILYSHAMLRRLAEARKSGDEPALRPDAKSQLSLRYENGKPVEVSSIVLSTQHESKTQTSNDIRAIVEPYIREVLPEGWVTSATEWWVNPTGSFVIGGPDGDAGLTGRKIIVDTYGGAAPHGGGAFSGKGPTKVDRSAAYAARYVAKNIVAAGLAKRCEIQVSYAIGHHEPTSIGVNTFGTGALPEDKIEALVRKHFNLRPEGLIAMLDLKRPIYQQTAAYGHFGREEKDFTWERCDKVDELKSAI
ncbi:MAG: methionine adenosyltransferase [Boseongicola sp.]